MSYRTYFLPTWLGKLDLEVSRRISPRPAMPPFE